MGTGFNLRPMKIDYREIVFTGFSNTLVLKDLYNKLRAKGSRFGVYDAVRRDISKHFNKHLKQVIQRDLNCVGEVIGKGGEGKSQMVLKIALTLKKYQLEYKKHVDAPLKFSHNIGQTKREIKEGIHGKIIIQDEFNELEGDNSNTIKKEFNNLIRSMRFTGICYLMSNVDFIYIKGLHFVLEMFGFNDTFFKGNNDPKMESIALLRYVDDNRPREQIYLGMVIMDVSDINEEYQKSLVYKEENWKKLEYSGGAV